MHAGSRKNRDEPIRIAGVATGQQRQEERILRAVFWHSLSLAALVGVLVMLQAYVFPSIVPWGTSPSPLVQPDCISTFPAGNPFVQDSGCNKSLNRRDSLTKPEIVQYMLAVGART